jgi:anaerobic ribonucleoside-triphosphate reductase activating protein
MKIGGLVPFSTTDYPGQLAAVIFCQGCPWRCRYCHNPHLQRFDDSVIEWPEAFSFLQKRVGFLDAVVFSGGEPLAQPSLPEAIKDIRRLGFNIGLHTAAAVPAALPTILPLIDWIGLDVKMVPSRYQTVTGVAESGRTIARSLSQIRDAGIDCEVRTTFHSALLSEQDLLEVAALVNAHDVKKFAVQIFREKGCSDRELAETATKSISRPTISQLQQMFSEFVLR